MTSYFVVYTDTAAAFSGGVLCVLFLLLCFAVIEFLKQFKQEKKQNEIRNNEQLDSCDAAFILEVLEGFRYKDAELNELLCDLLVLVLQDHKILEKVKKIEISRIQKLGGIKHGKK